MWSERSCNEPPSLLPEVEISHTKKKPRTTRIDGDETQEVTLVQEVPGSSGQSKRASPTYPSQSVVHRSRRRLDNTRRCDETQPELQSRRRKRQTAKAMAKKMKNGDTLSEQPNEPQPTKKKHQTKTMNKKSRKTLQDSIKSIGPDILIKEGTTALTEEFFDGHLSAFVADVYELKQMLTELVEYLRDTFAKLHAECKLEKNSQMQFQLKWYSYCSAFLLEEKHTLSAINLEEDKHPVLANLRQVWLEFCREQTVSLAE